MIVDEQPIRVLLVDRGASRTSSLASCLDEIGSDVTLCVDVPAMHEALAAEQFDVVILDAALPGGGDGATWRQLAQPVAAPEVLILADEALPSPALEAMSFGATGCLLRSANPSDTRVRVRLAWERRRARLEQVLHRTQQSRPSNAPDVVTQYAPMQAVLALVERVARSDTSMLITGEPGTGKALLGRLIHRFSLRSAEPLVTVECAATPDDRLETDLFGQDRDDAGSRPGTPGIVELASGGTLLLREIDALGPQVQGRLLRALELRSFYRVGGTQRVHADVRVIATSAHDGGPVDGETLRGDLYYRINTMSVVLPPLRERVCDIPLLARHFLDRARGLAAPRLTDEAVDALQRHAWPGNIRELQQVMERALLVARDALVRGRDLALGGVAAHGTTPHGDALLPLHAMERLQIERVLRHVSWHQGRAAELLGISPKTLYRKIKEYGLRRPSIA